MLAVGGSRGGVAVVTVERTESRDHERRHDDALRAAPTPRDEHSDAVRAIAWLPAVGRCGTPRRGGERRSDGDDHFATGCQDGSVRIWRVKRGDQRGVDVACVCELHDADAAIIADGRPICALAACALPLSTGGERSSAATSASAGGVQLGVLAVGDAAGVITLWCSDDRYRAKSWRRTRAIAAHRGAVVSLCAVASSAAASLSFGAVDDAYPHAAFVSCGRGGPSGERGATVVAWRCELRATDSALQVRSPAAASRTASRGASPPARASCVLEFANVGEWHRPALAVQSAQCCELLEAEKGDAAGSAGVCFALAGYADGHADGRADGCGAMLVVLRASATGDDAAHPVAWSQIARCEAHKPALDLALSSIAALSAPRKAGGTPPGVRPGALIEREHVALASGALDGSLRVTVFGIAERAPPATRRRSSAVGRATKVAH